MKTRYLLLLLAFLIASCSTGMNVPTTRPDDFSLFYHWEEGSLPPPYYYSYFIIIEPTSQNLPLGSFGLIRMEPDYPSEQTPVWAESFTVTEFDLYQLYALLLGNNFFRTKWTAQAFSPLGGSSEQLVVIAQGKEYIIPSFVLPGQEDAASKIMVAINELVPQAIWEKLDRQREQYMEEHQE